jgi:uncharacterized protein
MVIVTLVGEDLAVEGTEFTYLGANTECRNCQLKTVCFNLKSGRSYKITKLRDKRHNCAVHEGQVVVVEVEEQPITGMIDREATEGTSMPLRKVACRRLSCSYLDVCTNPAVQPGRSYQVQKNHGKVDCPKGVALYRVDVKE